MQVLFVLHLRMHNAIFVVDIGPYYMQNRALFFFLLFFRVLHTNLARLVLRILSNSLLSLSKQIFILLGCFSAPILTFSLPPTRRVLLHGARLALRDLQIAVCHPA